MVAVVEVEAIVAVEELVVTVVETVEVTEARVWVTAEVAMEVEGVGVGVMEEEKGTSK